MKNKNNICSMSKALKIYNIASIPKTTTYICIFSLLIYFIYIILINNKEESFLPNILMTMLFPISTILMIAPSFKKDFPGGKYFRSLPDGFEIFKKIKYAIMISVIIFQIIVPAVICAVNYIHPFMMYGTATCISVAVFSLLGIGVINIIQIFKNTAAQIISGLIILLLSISGVIFVILSDGKIGIILILTGITAIIIIPVSAKIMLNDYKKKYWKN